MDNLKIPKDFNYIGVFLTFTCQLRCHYCMNHHGGDLDKGRRIPGDEWIRAINRIETRSDLPVTLQGGEPTIHKDFYRIINGIRPDIPIDLLTNLEISAEQFSREIPANRLKRKAPYASIRVSYHHGQSNFEEQTSKVKYLLNKGYHIGIWEVDHPAYHQDVLKRQKIAKDMGIDYRLKEFLGPYRGKNYGTMRYEQAVNAEKLRDCECKTSELLIDSGGNIFRCHSDLYANRSSIGHMLDNDLPKLGLWRPCSVYGRCNSCDIKVKNNRFQKFGHSSVRVRNVSIPHSNNSKIVDVVNTYGKRD